MPQDRITCLLATIRCIRHDVCGRERETAHPFALNENRFSLIDSDRIASKHDRLPGGNHRNRWISGVGGDNADGLSLSSGAWISLVREGLPSVVCYEFCHERY